MMKSVLAACVLLCAVSVNADARPRHRVTAPTPGCVETVMRPCYATSPADLKEARRVARGRYIADQLGYGGVADRPVPRATRGRRAGQVQSYGALGATYVAAQIVSHPSGCPARAFCGCGAAVRVFGRPVRDLWLAANWLRFPRAAPAPGMVAARRGHVFVLESHLGGTTWQVFDANSGGHRTRIHARSIAGFAIVNPRGGAA